MCWKVTLFSFLPPEKPVKDYEFAQILKRSICLEQNTQAWCENCEKYQPTVSLGAGGASTSRLTGCKGVWEKGVSTPCRRLSGGSFSISQWGTS